MLNAIQQARESICFEIYLIKSSIVTSQFIDALVLAASHGINIQMLFDDFGSRGLKSADRIRLVRNNISVRYYNPVKWSAWSKNMIRDHRKLLLVDGKVAFVGGAGLSEEFAPGDSSQKSWRETIIRITGPVTADWQALFNQQWQQCVGGSEQIAVPSIVQTGIKSGIEPGLSGRVTISQGIGRQETKRAFIHSIRKAQKHVWLATAYFVPSWRLRRVLRHAARRQVDVRLLLPGTVTDHPAVRYVSHRFYSRLLRAGVRIYELSNRMQHQKVAVCDHWVSIGSSNFDRWNLRWNLEANQEVNDEDFSSQVTEMFRQDFENSREIQRELWQQRAWYHHWLESWWGWVSRLLSNIK